MGIIFFIKGGTMSNNELIESGLSSIKSRSDAKYENNLYITTDFSLDNVSFKIIPEMVNFDKIANDIKKIIRTSLEYKIFKEHLCAKYYPIKCVFFNNIDYANNGIELEMHHAPLTIHDCITIVLETHFSKGEAVTSLNIADEVMMLHFNELIGITFLSEIAHKLVHNGGLIVHRKQVIGDYLKFIEIYKDGLNDNHIEKIKKFLSVTEDDMQQSLAKFNIDRNAVRFFKDEDNIPRIEELFPTLGSDLSN